MVGRKGVKNEDSGSPVSNSEIYKVSKAEKELQSKVCDAIKSGNILQVLHIIETWQNDSKIKLGFHWDMGVGHSLWYRCSELKSASKGSSEVKGIQRCYKMLVEEFNLRCNAGYYANFYDRLQVLAVCNKFLIAFNKLDATEIAEEILQIVLEHLPAAREVDKNKDEEVKTILNSFYGVIWNHLRDNFDKLPVSKGFNLARESLAWLITQGVDQFTVVGHKLSQINYLFNKTASPSTIEKFIEDFVETFVIAADVSLPLPNQLKKGTKSEENELVASNFYGLINISFVIARFLVQSKNFEEATTASLKILHVGQIKYKLDSLILDTWKSALNAYIEYSTLFIWTPKSTQDLKNALKRPIISQAFETDHPRYTVALRYALIENVSWTASHFSSKENLLLSCNKLPQKTFTKFIKELISMATLENVRTRKAQETRGKIIGISEIKIWDNQVALLFHSLKIACDWVCDKNLQITPEISGSGENCFKSIKALAKQISGLEEKKISELYCRLSQYSCNMGFGFQKRKEFEDALTWCERSQSAYECWKSAGAHVEFKMNTQSMALLKADCLRQLNRPEEGLSWLAIWLKMHPPCLSNPSVTYDVYEQIPWTEWSTHWISCYEDVIQHENFDKTVVDLIEEEDPNCLTQKFTSKVLRFELNSHFAGRHGIPTAIVSIGEALLEKSESPFDNVLGFLARAIGYWWGTPDEVDFAVEMIEEAINFMGKEAVFKKEKHRDMTGFLSGLVLIWRGLCVLKQCQYFVEAEMDHLKTQLASENPEKYRDRDTGEERGVSGLSMLNLDHEGAWADSLIQGTEILFRFAASKDVLKKFSEEISPSLIILSSRLSASLLIGIGDAIHGVKAWHVVNKLAEVYDRKGLMVLSASEMLKVIPDLEMESVKLAEVANEIALEKKVIKHNRAVSYRLSLSKSLACYANKNFADGVEHLLKVFEFFNKKENFDSSHHLLGEATYVLSLYRAIQYSHEVDLSGFPSTIVQMSPAGMAAKGYKIICGMTREPDVHSSGWTDMCHNYYLLGSIMHIGAYTMRLLKDCGKTRELKCFLSDAVNFSQHCGFVSRSLSLIVPVIELDIGARNFLQAQLKIDAVYNIIKNSKCPEGRDEGDAETYQKLINNLKLHSLTSLERLENVAEDLQWNLKRLDTPSMNYRNRSEKQLSLVIKDLREGFDTEKFTFPSWMKHNLSCFCYVCAHPLILPTCFNFYHSQAKYLSCMSKSKAAMAVLETSKSYHERAIFRNIYNLSVFTIPLSVISSQSWASKTIEFIYTPFCVDSGLNALLTQMVICPAAELQMILNAMKKALQIIETLDPLDYIGKLHPLEIGISAIHQYFVNSGEIKIKGSEIRDILHEKMEVLEKENGPNRIQSPIPKENISPPPAVPKKGILKVGRKTKSTKEKVQPDDRVIPHHPTLVFDVEDSSESSEIASCSSSSSSSISVSRDAPQNVTKRVKEASKPPRTNITERRRRL